MLTVGDISRATLEDLLGRYALRLRLQADGEPIPGSFWGESEAGIVGDTVYARSDTPLHSLLHETCHIICMSADRRQSLDRDAGGDDLEECAVCYLQILLADCIAGLGRSRMLGDMDDWGYSFRLGSARRWFEEDAEDARRFLRRHALIDAGDRPSYRLRGDTRPGV